MESSQRRISYRRRIQVYQRIRKKRHMPFRSPGVNQREITDIISHRDILRITDRLLERAPKFIQVVFLGKMKQLISECARNYKKGLCEPEIRAIPSEVTCKQWELCMNQNPSTIDLQIRLNIYSEVINETINTLMNGFPFWKVAGFFGVITSSFILIFIISIIILRVMSFILPHILPQSNNSMSAITTSISSTPTISSPLSTPISIPTPSTPTSITPMHFPIYYHSTSVPNTSSTQTAITPNTQDSTIPMHIQVYSPTPVTNAPIYVHSSSTPVYNTPLRIQTRPSSL
ncbi:9975_t:CDS:2 [Diversispora eburnea]|uniref:9975_t:CDS:1 n=1 Tax=Diversispora eburnea TaxID=1213867 RepID=A0A9N8WGZ6_9GLOM|nr:9975_t:CDS:2 [Diversispora eburnea]